MKAKILTILTFCCFVLGCVSQYNPPRPPKSDPAEVKLAEAAVSASDSLNTLQAIRKAENPDYQKNLPDVKTYGMGEYATVDWTGPIEPLVRQLAKASNYRLRVLGNPPEIPVIVAINAENTPLAEILRNADYQAGKKAFIHVYPKSRIIELRYPQ